MSRLRVVAWCLFLFGIDLYTVSILVHKITVEAGWQHSDSVAALVLLFVVVTSIAGCRFVWLETHPRRPGECPTCGSVSDAESHPR